MLNILISQRIFIDSHGQVAEGLEATYRKFFNSLGLNVYPVSNIMENLSEYLNGIHYDGLILTGGGNVSVEFGGIKNDTRQNCFPDRDRVCSALVDKMIAQKLPVLGICYGMQLLNCYFGGKLVADIHSGELDHRNPGNDHAINIEKSIFDLQGKYFVNHYHNHGLRRATVADCFDVFAEDANFDVTEGIIHKDLAVIGIQWHPERKSPDVEFNKRLIKNFFKI